MSLFSPIRLIVVNKEFEISLNEVFFTSGCANFFQYLFQGMIFFSSGHANFFQYLFQGIHYAPRYFFLSGHSHFFQYLFQGIQYAPRRNVKLKTELIDVDLVRGIKKNTGF